MARAADDDAGATALEAADWDGARRAFEASLAGGETPDARAGLGQALFFLGRVDEAVHERERAVDGYLAAGRCDEAARLAVWVAHQHWLAGRTSAARGWLARAERSLDGVQVGSPGRGWVAVERARQSVGVQERVTGARRAMRIGRATGTADLEVYALSLLGRAVVTSGRRDEGLRLLEEAMAAASSGRVRDVHVLAEAYCNLIEGCAAVGDWERGAEWCELVEAFAVSHRTDPLFGACRTVHADVLLATGQWTRAEVALQAALTTLARHVPAMAAPARTALAELRVRQGRLLEADRLLADGADEPGRLRALALLRLAEGRPADAAALLEQALEQATEHPVRAAQLLGPLVQARLADADRQGAAVAAADLRGLAAATGIHLVEALAELAASRVAVATGQPEQAAASARRALASFAVLAMPYEAAHARLELARAVAASAPDLAAEQARLAQSAFRDLGAAGAVDATAQLLRALGSGTPPGPRTTGGLTVREREVLGLVALGASNADVAAALCISEKTAGHHVSRILAKLGVRNRTEAAAHAGRLAVPTS